MAETTDSKTRQQNQQAYREYQEALNEKAQRAKQQESKNKIDNELFQALETLKTGRGTDAPQNDIGADATSKRMKAFQTKVAPYQTWGSIAGMPLIAKDSFAPMFGGTNYAQNAREYLFNRRLLRTQTSARVDKDEALRLVGRMDPTEVKGKSTSELTSLARDKYFARTASPLTPDEAVKFAKMKLDSMHAAGGSVRDSQYKFLGLKHPNSDPGLIESLRNTVSGTPIERPKSFSNSQLKSMVKEKAIGDFHARQTGVRGSLGKILYGDSNERRSVLKNLPVDLSGDTALGRAAGVVGHSALVGATALPAFSVGLGSAAQYQKLRNLRRDRQFTGKAGHVAEGATTLSGLIRAGIFAPAATAMAAPALSSLTKGAGHAVSSGISGLGSLAGNTVSGGLGLAGDGISALGGNVPILKHLFRGAGSAVDATGQIAGGAIKGVGNVASMPFDAAGHVAGGAIAGGGNFLYRHAKDSAFGLTSALGGGVLKGVSGLANTVGIGGGKVDLGASLAGAAKGVGFGASMAGMTPALIGGLAMALPGIIGSISGNMAEKKKRITRGFKQPTDKLIKQFSRSTGIDSVIRSMFSSNAITSDRMLELQLLMYIEQNTAPIPKMVADTGLMSDRKEKDSNETIGAYGRHQREAVQDAYESDRFGGRFKRRAKYMWDRTLTGAQGLSHSINIPGQIMDFLINRKTPFARKEERRQAREEAAFLLKNPAHLKKAAGTLNTSAGHVQLMGISAARLIRTSGAQSVESQQLALQAGIYDLLRLQFRMGARDRLKGTGIGLTPRVAEEEITGFRKFLHSIPGISAIATAFEGGKTAYKSLTSIPEKIRNSLIDYRAAKAGTLQLGHEKSGVGRFLSKNIVGREQIARLDEIRQIKEKMGLSKSNSEKIETFQLKLPEYWEELLHLGRQSIEALHNIFNVGNKALAYAGAGEIAYNSRGSEQKVFDYASGQSLTKQDYNRLITDRRDTFDKELTTQSPSLLTRGFRKIFGDNASRIAQQQKSLQQFSTDEDFKLSNASGSEIPQVIMLGGPGPAPQLTGGGSGSASNPCCPEVNNCCDENRSTRADFIGSGRQRSNVGSRPSTGNGYPYGTLFGPDGKPVGSEDPNRPRPDRTPGSDTGASHETNRTATDELNENESEEERKKREEARKQTKFGFKEIINLLKSGLGVKSGPGGTASGGGGLLDKLGSIASGVFSFLKVAAPLLIGLKAFQMMDKYRSDGGSEAPGTGAFGKMTDSVVKGGRALIGAGAAYGVKKLEGVLGKPIIEGGLKTAIKAGFTTGGVKGAFGAVSKVAGKAGIHGGSAVAKSLLKKIPILGAVVGVGLAASRAWKGDFVGAGMELASGLLGMIPGPGWAIALAIDAAILGRDIAKAMSETGEVPPELQAKAAAIDESAKKNLSEKAYSMYADKLDQLKDLQESGELVYNKKDKKWYCKDEIDAEIKKSTDKDAKSEKKGFFSRLFNRNDKPTEDPGTGHKWKRIDHKFGSTWEKVPVDGKESQTSTSTPAQSGITTSSVWDKTKTAFGKAKDFAGSMFSKSREVKDSVVKSASQPSQSAIGALLDWKPLSFITDPIKKFGSKLGETFTAIDDAKDAYFRYQKKQLVSFAKEMKDKAIGMFDDFMSSAKRRIFDTWNGAKKWASDKLTSVKDALMSSAKFLYESSGLKSVVDWTSEKIDQAKEMYNNAKSWVSDKYQDVKSAIYNSGPMKWIKERMEGPGILDKTILKANEIERKYNDGKLASDERLKAKAGTPTEIASMLELERSKIPTKNDAMSTVELANMMERERNKNDKNLVPFESKKVTPEMMKQSTAVSLRLDEELPTVKETHRQEQQVKIPTHSSAPSAMNAGMSGSQSQLVKDRPINPMIDGFIDQLFTNTINVFQQSIKSFAIGQTPFQILR